MVTNLYVAATRVVTMSRLMRSSDALALGFKVPQDVFSLVCMPIHSNHWIDHQLSILHALALHRVALVLGQRYCEHQRHRAELAHVCQLPVLRIHIREVHHRKAATERGAQGLHTVKAQEVGTTQPARCVRMRVQ